MAANAVLNSVVVSGAANAYPTGLAATGVIGTPSIVIDVAIAVVGTLGTTALGNASVRAAANVYPTGVAATTTVGSVTVTATANVFPVGVYAVGELGYTNVWGLVPTNNTVLWGAVDTGLRTLGHWLILQLRQIGRR